MIFLGTLCLRSLNFRLTTFLCFSYPATLELANLLITTESGVWQQKADLIPASLAMLVPLTPDKPKPNCADERFWWIASREQKKKKKGDGVVNGPIEWK